MGCCAVLDDISMMNNIVIIASRPARISAKLRHALALMAREGPSQVEAAKMAGLSRQGL